MQRMFPILDQEPAMATTRLITAEDLWLMDNDGQHYELVNGELITMPPAGGEHGEIGFTLTALIGAYLAQNRIGRGYSADTGFILARNPDVVRSPDVSVVLNDRLPPEAERRSYLEIAPDLAVEIVSPSDSSADVNDKVMQYIDFGIKLVWVIYPSSRSVSVFTPDRRATILGVHDELDGGHILPGFKVRVHDLFT
jgi:Uma2 family endonuclease